MISSLLKLRSVSITLPDSVGINGTVREATVGEYVSFATKILKFLDLSDLSEEGKSEEQIIDILGELVAQSPEILALISSMCDLRRIDNSELVKFEDLPITLATEVITEIKEANSDFLSKLLSQVKAMHPTQETTSDLPASTSTQ